QVVVVDGRAIPIERQTCSLTATIMTPWAPVTIRLALAVMPGEDDLLVLGLKTLREKLSIDVMKQLRDRAAASAGGASNTEHAPAEIPAMSPEIIGVRRVAVTMEAMQQVADTEVEAAGETGGFKDALLDRVPKMMRDICDSEMKQQPPAQVEPMRVVWTPTARTTKAKSRLYAPEKRAWLSEQMKMLERAHMVYLNPQATFASVAMALPK
ncbi:unnamed protein product, partial [Ascophyllum nodosum]